MAGACPNGHEVSEGAKFCSECGAQIDPAPDTTSGLAANEPADTDRSQPSPNTEEPTSAVSQAGERALLLGDPPRRKRRSWRRRLAWVAVAVVALAVIGAVAGNGKKSKTPPSADTAAQTTTNHRPSPPPTPTRYAQLLPHRVTIHTLMKTGCGSYRAIIARWDSAGRTRTAALASLQSDPYVAADFVSHVGNGWVRAHTQTGFSSAVSKNSRTLLVRAVKAKRRFLTDEMVARFQDDALFVCHLGSSYVATDNELTALDAKTSAAVSLASEKPWYPKGWSPAPNDATIAYTWHNNVQKCQDPYSTDGEYCWGIKVMTQNGCPSNVYAALNILQGSTVIDYSNDTLAALEPGQVGELGFKAFENTSGQLQGQLKEIDCY